MVMPDVPMLSPDEPTEEVHPTREEMIDMLSDEFVEWLRGLYEKDRASIGYRLYLKAYRRLHHG